MLNLLVWRFLKVEVIMRNVNFGKELIKKKIPLVSKSPGVYRMLGKKNQVLYVGKAKNLPKRLKDYAMGKNLTIRTNRMLALTHNLEIVTTNSEAEALLLEANLIKKFKEITNCPVLVNTSFNIRGEPIVNTPEDAFNCFMGTELDVLVIGNCYLEKNKQNLSLKKNYSSKFKLD